MSITQLLLDKTALLFATGLQILLIVKTLLSSVPNDVGFSLDRFCCAMTEPCLSFIRKHMNENCSLYTSLDMCAIAFSVLLGVLSCALVLL